MSDFEQQLQHAQIFYDQGRYDRAVELLYTALSSDPENPTILYLLATSLFQLDELDEAQKHAETLLSILPDASEALILLGNIAIGRHKPKIAEKYARQAQEWDPDDPAVHALLAQSYVMRKKWKEAIDAAEAGLREDPDHEVCLNLRSFALNQRGEFTAAQDDIERSLELDPDDPYTHANAGWSHLRRGNNREARTHFTEALRLDPDNEWAREGLIESIKTTNIFYRYFFRFLLFVESIPTGTLIIILIGTVMLRKFLIDIAENSPLLALPANLIVWGIFGLFMMLMISQPISNAAIMLHPLGRLALSIRERIQSFILLASIVILISCGVSVYYSPASFMTFDIGIYGILLLVPITFASFPMRLLLWSRAALIAVSLILCSLTVISLGSRYIYAVNMKPHFDKLEEVGFYELEEDENGMVAVNEEQKIAVESKRAADAEFNIYWTLFTKLSEIALWGLIGFTWVGGMLIAIK